MGFISTWDSPDVKAYNEEVKVKWNAKHENEANLYHEIQRPVTNYDGYVRREAAEHRQSAIEKTIL